LANSFIIFDDAKVMVETISAELTITQSREIALYVKAFQALSATAVYGAEARRTTNGASPRPDEAWVGGWCGGLTRWWDSGRRDLDRCRRAGHGI